MFVLAHFFLTQWLGFLYGLDDVLYYIRKNLCG